jgi:formamidopyrimidine-DNA glycosylase
MPELPEVEVTRLSFADRILGAQIQSIRLGLPLRWPLGQPPQQLMAKWVGPVQRRGKYLWLSLLDSFDQPPQDTPGLLLHLGMSGSLSFEINPAPAGPYDHFEMVTSLGVLRLRDPRRFGAVIWSPSLTSGMAYKLLQGLGIEPFDPQFSGAYLYAALHHKTSAIKVALLSGQTVVGAGNIYVSEALFRARIRPQTRCSRISLARYMRLAEAIQFILRQAIELGGSSIRDFQDTHGLAGKFQQQAGVYGREGQPCTVCQTLVRRIIQGQRSTFFCPSCQRP